MRCFTKPNLHGLRRISLISLALWMGCTLHVLSQENDWITFEKCPVMLEHMLSVPAQERGIIKALHVEVNQSVPAGVALADLDSELVDLELRAARLEYGMAVEVARDDSNVEYHQIALKKVEEELNSYRSISTSVSESEIRRLTLGVDQAKLALVRARQAKKAALGDAQLKQAAVEIAELRLARRHIDSPLSGIVTAIKIQPGQAVEAGQTILEIWNLENLIVDRLIPISQFNLADLVDAEVRVDARQADGTTVRLSGRIVSYDPEVSSAGLVRVHARVKNLRRGNHWVVLRGQEVTMYVAKSVANSRAAHGLPAINR